jgi:hypothetical protein
MKAPNRNPHRGRKTDAGIITDEMCRCGHSRQVHHDIHPIAAAGHGACGTQCGCAKFTWAKFVKSKDRFVK